jgi:cytochrome c oxidase subunit 2
MNHRRGALSLLFLLAIAVVAPAAQEPVRHEITIKARNHQFTPARFDVTQGDIVKITLVAEDAPYSFVIDDYRIAKRAAPGKPVTFEFRADRAGTFVYYCNLSSDAACKDMRGQFVVAAKQ